MKLLRQLKTMLHVGYLNGWSKNNPLAGYKLHFEKADRGYLTDEDLCAGDLAELYGVETKALNRAVKRNIERFPERFMFQLTKEEALRCRFGTLNDMPLERGKHMKYLPYAFTEQGVSMLSAVLRSPTAIQVSISIMDGFVAMRNCILARTAEAVELPKRSAARRPIGFRVTPEKGQ